LVATKIDPSNDSLRRADFNFLDLRLKDCIKLFLDKKSDFLDAENTCFLAERKIMEEN